MASRWQRRGQPGRFYRGGRGFKKGKMTGFDMASGVTAASLSVTCLSLGAWGVYYGIKEKEDELHSLYILLGFISLPLATLIGYWANEESWIVVLVTFVVMAGIFFVRSLLAFEDRK